MGRIMGDMKNVSSARTHRPERRARATEASVASTVAATIATSATSRLLSAARWIWLELTGSNRSRYHWSDSPDGGNLIERPSVNDVSSTIHDGPDQHEQAEPGQQADDDGVGEVAGPASEHR